MRLVLALTTIAAFAQQRPQGPVVSSPEVSADRKITLRLLAPNATDVKVNGGDIPGAGGTPLVKGENGVWEVTLGPVVPGSYRYTFNVNGVAAVDPRNPANSESNNNVWSVVNVPGSEWFDTKDVPHGAIGSVTYHSKSLGRARRMQVYTPPGYELSNAKYPVFYLLHGASDSDDSWTSVGRANFILDNLIAAKKAKPMIVVMPAGHTTSGGFRVPGQRDEFAKDFVEDIMPYIESHYRVAAGRNNRAIAGLSMGGNQTLAVGIPHLDKFAYLGVYSSGLIGAFGSARPGMNMTPDGGAAWEKENAAVLANTKLKKDLKLMWFGIGTKDFLLETNRGTVALLKKHGFTVTTKETDGAHTWLEWRNYLAEFTPMLFQ
ncbi:MAG: esterase [Acidobacteria bacterium]|nr:esterase [Acidobacteriota bacterium]